MTFVPLVAITAACSLFSAAGPVDVKPVHTATSDPSLLSDEGVYQDAVRKITSRDYGSALDFLQVARSRDPGDVRIFNAMGVVYDKLGRFDLSARYYAQANALAPNSKIVENNIAYSAILRKKMDDPAAVSKTVIGAQRSMPPITSELEVKSVHAKASTFQIAPTKPAAEPSVATAIPDSARAWGGVVIVAGSDEKLAFRISRELERLRWATSKSIVHTGLLSAQTTIRYASTQFAAAKSLAHTLPFPSRLAVCDDDCHGVVLVLGTDSGELRDDTRQTTHTKSGVMLARQ